MLQSSSNMIEQQRSYKITRCIYVIYRRLYLKIQTSRYLVMGIDQGRTFFNQQLFDRSNHRISNIEYRISNIELRIRIFNEWFGNPSYEATCSYGLRPQLSFGEKVKGMVRNDVFGEWDRQVHEFSVRLSVRYVHDAIRATNHT